MKSKNILSFLLVVCAGIVLGVMPAAAVGFAPDRQPDACDGADKADKPGCDCPDGKDKADCPHEKAPCDCPGHKKDDPGDCPHKKKAPCDCPGHEKSPGKKG